MFEVEKGRSRNENDPTGLWAGGYRNPQKEDLRSEDSSTGLTSASARARRIYELPHCRRPLKTIQKPTRNGSLTWKKYYSTIDLSFQGVRGSSSVCFGAWTCFGQLWTLLWKALEAILGGFREILEDLTEDL